MGIVQEMTDGGVKIDEEINVTESEIVEYIRTAYPEVLFEAEAKLVMAHQAKLIERLKDEDEEVESGGED